MVERCSDLEIQTFQVPKLITITYNFQFDSKTFLLYWILRLAINLLIFSQFGKIFIIWYILIYLLNFEFLWMIKLHLGHHEVLMKRAIIMSAQIIYALHCKPFMMQKLSYILTWQWDPTVSKRRKFLSLIFVLKYSLRP